MQDKPDDKSKSAQPSSEKPEDDKLVEQRVDKMMDPKLPDEPPAEKPAAGASAERSLPPINIFKETKTAPDLPENLAANNDGKTAPADNSAKSAVGGEDSAEDSGRDQAEGENTGLDDPKTDAAVDEITAQESDEVLAAEDAEIAQAFEKPKPAGRFKRILKCKWTWVTVVILLIIAAAIVPFTRYKVLGLFMKQTFNVVVMDSETHTPVSSAQLVLDGHSVETSSTGKASVKVPVGHRTLNVTKEYYKHYSSDVLVPLSKMKHTFKVQLVATGRQVPIKVVNKITGRPLSGAEVRVLDTEAKTDNKGQATIVLPTAKSKQAATIELDGYNTAKTSIQVTSKTVKPNTFQLVPSGKVYFLSNLSGNIDVMSSNLDGSGRQTVLAGTGNEDSNSTALLASSNWKYLALLAKRDNSQYAKLYLINTTTGQLTTIDSTASDINLIGWHGDDFLYDATEANSKQWQNGHEVIKSYDAATGRTAALDKSQAAGKADSYAYQSFYNFNVSGNNLVYATQWYSVASSGVPMNLAKKKDSIRAIDLGGQTKKDGQTFPAASVSNIQATLPKPGTIYFSIDNFGASNSVHYEFRNNVLQPIQGLSQQTFSKNYPTYLKSPDGQKVFWAEVRDGKNTLLTGNTLAQNSKSIAKLSDYSPYGWYSEKYLLVSKSGSELYIMPVDGSGQPLKITDYYKPQLNVNDYGYAYGGL